MNGITAFTTHGLWPSFYSAIMKDGTAYPTFCETMFTSTSQQSEVGMISYKDLKGRRLHQWKKHGSCSGMSITNYFQAEKQAKYNSQLLHAQKHLQSIIYATTQNKPTSTSPPVVSIRELQHLLGGGTGTGSGRNIEKSKNKNNTLQVAIKANRYCALEEVTICYSYLQAQGVTSGSSSVGPQVDCPSHVMSSRRNNAVLQGCAYVVLDVASTSKSSTGTSNANKKDKKVGAGEQCTFVSKSLLKTLKDQRDRSQ